MARVFLIVCDFFSVAQQPVLGQGLLIFEASRSQTEVSRISLDERSAQRSVCDIET
jgi:hypothetical protein